MRVPSAKGIIELCSPFNDPNTIDGLEGASHLWILYLFSQHAETPWRAKVRPPRLGGEKKIGVFASRSPVRPNPIGLTCVLLEKIEHHEDKILLHVCGVDMVDETPIIDIKPYQKDVDCFPEARLAWVDENPWRPKLKIVFAEALAQLLTTDERQLITEVLSLDPRPSNQRSKDGEAVYKLWLGQWDVSWHLLGPEIHVTELVKRP